MCWVIKIQKNEKAKINKSILGGADIKNDKGKINDNEALAKAIDSFLYTSYPYENGVDYERDISKTQQATDRISKIKFAIQQAETLGL